MTINKKKVLICIVVSAMLVALTTIILCHKQHENTIVAPQYKEVIYPTPNIDSVQVNDVQGVILHHTAESTIEKALAILSSPEKKVGTHVVIDTDGTRYIMAKPSVVTYHAGYSILDGRERCNEFTIGIEFQGNTLKKPLTKEQIQSGIEYLIPIMKKYNIPVNHVVTHKMVRNEYKKKYPEKKCFGKVDISDTEYQRFMHELKKHDDIYNRD